MAQGLHWGRGMGTINHNLEHLALIARVYNLNIASLWYYMPEEQWLTLVWAL